MAFVSPHGATGISSRIITSALRSESPVPVDILLLIFQCYVCVSSSSKVYCWVEFSVFLLRRQCLYFFFLKFSLRHHVLLFQIISYIDLQVLLNWLIVETRTSVLSTGPLPNETPCDNRVYQIERCTTKNAHSLPALLSILIQFLKFSPSKWMPLWPRIKTFPGI